MKSSKTIPWLRLIRLPGLFTVPGDVLVGMLAATAAAGHGPAWGSLVVVSFILICLYVSTVILKDCFNLTEDWHRGRWERPLVAGEISLDRAYGAALVLILVAIGLAWFAGIPVLITILILLAMLVSSGFAGRRFPAAKTVAMGLFHGGAVVAGAIAQAPRDSTFYGPVGLTALGMAGYVILIIQSSAYLERPHKFGRRLLIPVWYLLLFFLITFSTAALRAPNRMGLLFGSGIFIILIVTLLRRLVGLYMAGTGPRIPIPVYSLGNHLILRLTVIQAALAAFFGGGTGLILALLLLTVLLPSSLHLTRFFPDL